GQTEIRTAPTVAAVAATQVPAPAPDEQARRRRRNWIIAGCVAAALVVAGLVYFLLAGGKQTVPNVVGRSAGDAQSRLAEAGFKSQVFMQENKAPVGEVFKQSPAGGEKAKKNSTVILNVSSGPGKVTMPDVEGLTRVEADRKLKGLGLEVKARQEFSKEVKKGRATRTVPAAGDQAERGSIIELYISKGPEQVEVPNVVDMDVDAAIKELEAEGFEVETTEQDSAKPENQVIKQSPAATSRADEGSTVELTVASGKNDVPDVTGLSESDAIQELEDAGFEVDSSQIDVIDQADDGSVVGQTPQSGSLKVGSTVSIEVGVFGGSP
ncbi:MAG: PASTA domain-containing protein, partial [Solirubrobacterales bacterium]